MFANFAKRSKTYSVPRTKNPRNSPKKKTVSPVIPYRNISFLSSTRRFHFLLDQRLTRGISQVNGFLLDLLQWKSQFSIPISTQRTTHENRVLHEWHLIENWNHNSWGWSLPDRRKINIVSNYSHLSYLQSVNFALLLLYVIGEILQPRRVKRRIRLETGSHASVFFAHHIRFHLHHAHPMQLIL